MEKTRVRKETDKAVSQFEKPFEVGLYFGFNPVKTPTLERDDHIRLKALRDPYYDEKRIHSEAPFTFDALEKIALLRTFAPEGNDLSQPVFISYKKPIPGTFTKRPSDFVMGLEVLGHTGSAAEALCLKTAIAILEEEGCDNLKVTLNSLGDKDSVQEFERMVGVFVRKHMNGFPADIRKMARNDIFDILRSEDEKHAAVQAQAPKSLSFLSETSRLHFKEVLEYLEVFDIPYEMSPRLIGSPAFCSHTIFEIRNDKNEILAQGYRYSRLSKKLGYKREVAALGVTISFKKKTGSKLYKAIPKPKFYLVQLGFGAKLAVLPLIDMLRKAKMSVAHSIARDKLGSQLATAENMKVPYVLIVGQKEAIEKSVTVRNMNTRVQETVSVANIVEFLKKLK